MDTRKKLEIEPLSEARVARIEHALFERLRRTPVTSPPASEGERRLRWKPAVALVFAGAAAAVLGGLGLRGVLAPHSGPTSAIVAAPSRVTAGHAGSHVDLGGSALDLAPDTEALVSGDDARGVLVDLERGAIDFEVAPRQGRPPFVVRAGEVRVSVIGTHFRVSRDAASTAVDVARGIVEVATPAEVTRLEAGAHWSWPHVAPQPPAMPAEPVDTNQPPTSPPTAESPAPPGTAPAPGPAPRPSAPKSSSPMDRYNEAAQLEGRRPDEALAIYRDLASGSGPWAMNALFAEGRLQADRGLTDDAQRLLSDYLSRYPQGPNADDARRLLDRIR